MLLLVTVNLRYDIYCMALYYALCECAIEFLYESDLNSNRYELMTTTSYSSMVCVVFWFSIIHRHMFSASHGVCACVCVRGTLCLAVDLLSARNFPCSRYGELILENEIHIKHCCSVWFQLTRRFELFFSRGSQLFEHHTLHHYWYYFVWRKSVDM